ncbi:hypothetical protein M422DRAFT_245398 [Sphaerobolus stellatus SS14]|nr:hypothetical protein M422DRAFT_245398 [Sphaerobolus stellatus SS14]
MPNDVSAGSQGVDTDRLFSEDDREAPFSSFHVFCLDDQLTGFSRTSMAGVGYSDGFNSDGVSPKDTDWGPRDQSYSGLDGGLELGRILPKELYVKSLGDTFSVDLKETHCNNPQEELISVYSTLQKEKFNVLDEAKKEHWEELAASLKAELEVARETFTSEAIYEHFTTMFEFWGQCGWYFHIIAASSPVEGQAKSWCLTHTNGYKFLRYDIYCQNYKEHVTDEWHHFVNTCYTKQMLATLQTKSFLQNGCKGNP